MVQRVNQSSRYGCSNLKNKNTFGNLYIAYPALPGGSRRWEHCVTQVTQQTGNRNERSRTATSRSQQLLRTKSWFTATAGIRTSNLRIASAPLTARPNPTPTLKCLQPLTSFWYYAFCKPRSRSDTRCYIYNCFCSPPKNETVDKSVSVKSVIYLLTTPEKINGRAYLLKTDPKLFMLHVYIYLVLRCQL
jgi:hypothetical protein